MLHKKRSSLGGRKVSPPQPSYMNDEQKSNYLNDLRNNRPSRPTGSRPAPFKLPTETNAVPLSAIQHDIPADAAIGQSAKPRKWSLPKSASFQSTFTHKGRPLVNSIAGKIGNGRKVSPTESISSIRSLGTSNGDESTTRKAEKEEAHFLKEALEYIDHKDEEKRLFEAAQFEAADLVWQHRNPQAAEDEKTAPYLNPDLEQRPIHSKAASSRRRSSGNRMISNGSSKGAFRNPEDQIYEEPDEVKASTPQYDGPQIMPLRTRARNSLPRGSRPLPEKSMTMPDLTATKLNRFEIWKNPPSQSRDAEYIKNTPPRTPVEVVEEVETPKSRASLEIRSEDIRAATSMRKKDRSPNLPTPVAVSDNVGRPIVSFDPTWKRTPKNNVDLGRPSTSASSGQHQPEDEQDWGWEHKLEKPVRSMPAIPVVAVPSAAIPTINLPDTTSQLSGSRDNQRPGLRPIPAIPTLAVSAPAVPTINLPGKHSHVENSDHQRPAARPMPTLPAMGLSTPAIPTINLPDEGPSIPSINIEPEPEIVPTISISVVEPSSVVPSNAQADPSSARPLPKIQTQPARPLPHHTQSAPPSAPPKRLPWLSRGGTIPSSTVSCSICTHPISGRILTTPISSTSTLKARLHPECFACFHCQTPLECVSFYPEPTNFRTQRLSESNLPPDSLHDLRFYCHLDFHESFSPRCRSCKTPIEGSTVVACGHTYHPDHFFCAECGDPFTPDTPFVEKDNYAYCVGCHTKRTSARCRECKAQILDEVAVEALGAKWHEDCFRCCECKGGFGDEGRFFVREVRVELTEKEKRRGVKVRVEERAVCNGCEERRLKA